MCAVEFIRQLFNHDWEKEGGYGYPNIVLHVTLSAVIFWDLVEHGRINSLTHQWPQQQQRCRAAVVLKRSISLH
jgi:hypothetical protein